MTTSKRKSIDVQNSNTKVESLVQKLYDLRKRFEADYTGRLRSYKYEEARDFTIALNHAIFQANQMIDTNPIKMVDSPNLEDLLENLKTDYNFLKS